MKSNMIHVTAIWKRHSKWNKTFVEKQDAIDYCNSIPVPVVARRALGNGNLSEDVLFRGSKYAGRERRDSVSFAM